MANIQSNAIARRKEIAKHGVQVRELRLCDCWRGAVLGYTCRLSSSSADHQATRELLTQPYTSTNMYMDIVYPDFVNE